MAKKNVFSPHRSTSSAWAEPMLGSRSRGRRRNAWVALGWLVLASWHVASSGRDAVAESAYRNDEINVA